MSVKLCHLVLFVFMGLLLVSCEFPKQSSRERVEFKSQSGPEESHYIPRERFLVLHPEEILRGNVFEKTVFKKPQRISRGIQLKPVTIAVVYPSDQISDYWRRNLKSFLGRLNALSIQHEVMTFFSRGGGTDLQLQERQLRKAFESDPDYLIFTLDVRMHKKVIEQALTRRRPRIFLQNITMPLMEWEGYQPFYVGFDHITGTRLLADYFIRHSSVDDKFGVLFHSLGYVSATRGTSFLEMMREGNRFGLKASYYTDNIREQSKKAALELLEEEEIKFIYACSTDVALGAIDALVERNLVGEVMVNGWGGGSAELASLEKGEMSVSVMRMTDDSGIAMAEAIRLDLENRSDELPIVFSGRFELVTDKTTSDEFRRLKEIAFRYSDLPKAEQ